MGYGLGFIKRLRLRFSDYAFRVHGLWFSVGGVKGQRDGPSVLKTFSSGRSHCKFFLCTTFKVPITRSSITGGILEAIPEGASAIRE